MPSMYAQVQSHILQLWPVPVLLDSAYHRWSLWDRKTLAPELAVGEVPGTIYGVSAKG